MNKLAKQDNVQNDQTLAVKLTRLLAWPIGRKLHLLSGGGVPKWLDSFAGYVTDIGRCRYKIMIPVDDNKERWVSAKQLQINDPWTC